ncbi:MAG: ACP S-malonyltransferase [Sedimenticola sp.]|nr:ACP S-malonyltransferase [Sedimenticola sp.]
MKQTAVVICPGRGSYDPQAIGYLQRHHAGSDLVALVDDYRRSRGEPTVSELDRMPEYRGDRHAAGEHASALIHACALADYARIDRKRFEVVAVTGNSMGWYLALAAAGALDPDAAIALVDGMGGMMREGLIGGQLLYPVVDEAWQPLPEVEMLLQQQLEQVNRLPGCAAYPSIDLGGMRVIGGNDQALDELKRRLPPSQGRYPALLARHAAFHTPLLAPVSSRARELFPQGLFQRPGLPLIDGRGHVWQPLATDTGELRDYTLGEQVVAPFSFSSAINVAIKEFAPDRLILLGPGSSLGASVGQLLVRERWLGLVDKARFKQRQAEDPFLLSMAVETERKRVVK